MKPYFTLRKAQELIRKIPSNMSDVQLQKHIVRLLDFKRYIDTGDTPRLTAGGYYTTVIDASASGVVPQDIWLQTNLGQALDEVIAEREKRLVYHK